MTTKTCKLKSKKTKINKYIEFNEILDMSNFAPDVEPEKAIKDPKYYEFKLKGLIIHEGNADYGHYYSLIKTSNAWYEFNDKIIKLFDPVELKERAYGNLGEKQSSKGSAYVLLYQREVFYDDQIETIPTLYHNIKEAHINTIDATLMNMFKENEFIGYHEKMMMNESFSNLIFTLHTYIKDKQIGFRLLLKYFLLYMIRDMRKQKIPEIYKMLLNDLRHSVESAIYLLKNFMNREVVLEFLVQCPIKDMIYVVFGLVKNALKTILADLDHISKEDNLTVRKFIHCIVNHIIYVNNSLLSEEGLLLVIDSLTENKYYCKILRTSQYENYLNYYFFGGCNLHLDFDADELSEFSAVLLVDGHSNKPKDRSNKELEPVIYKSMLLRSAAKYFLNLGKNTYPMSYLFRLDLWEDIMQSSKHNSTYAAITDFFIQFTKNYPIFLEKMILNARLNVHNFKAYFYLFLKLVTMNKRNINEMIIERSIKMLYDKSFNNYIVFDYLVHFILEACLLSEDFFNTIIEKETLLQTLINKNNYTQDVARCEIDHVN